ncbi:MAG: hypothetical protein CL789_01315 [Chloroflexi bacterium]|nr:hypothetical protein [Chloroflexota bacterium]MBS60663.1 hypothetical protein [Anaerolineaceae bacterium]HCU80243.1 hypothetical protein [Chloroflexota bacterium]|tara:strand:- start:674 stop:1078 length:405 start_codon:yes stop_codon:yes gene_type:complete
MDSTTIFVAAVVFIVINIIGIAVTLAVVLYQLNVLVSGGALVVPPDTGPVDAMERIAWKKQRDDKLASKARLSSAYRTGVMVLLWLALLTAIEFVANVIGVSTVAMFLIAFIKAAIILQFFMHVSSLWIEGESH